jgi:RND superfamily putative drug exporter
MSLALFRLGRQTYRHPWITLAAWVLILLGVAGAVAAAGGGTIATNISIDGTRSQAVQDELRAKFPVLAGGQGEIVFRAEEGQRWDEGASAAALRDAAEQIHAVDAVVTRPATSAAPGALPRPSADRPHPLAIDGAPVPGVLISGDGSTAVMQLQFTHDVADLEDGVIDGIVDVATARASAVGGQALVAESLKPHSAPLGGSEAVGIAFALVVLILTLGSLRTALLPLVTATAGVGIGLGTALALSDSIEMTSATPVLALMVGLAVGMDYALFIANRARRLMLYENLPAAAAVPRAVGTAGSAVTFAGLTVIIALTGLTLIGISFLTTMALVAAATVALAVLIAITLLPALLRLVGERLAGPRARARAAGVRRAESIGRRWPAGVVRHRGLVTAVVAGGLLAMAIPAASMTLGMPDGSTADAHTSERQAFDAVADAFGPGYNAPLITVVTAREGGNLSAVELPGIAAELGGIAGVATAVPMGVSPDGTVAVLTVIPTEGPTAQGTVDLVHELRDGGAQRLGPGIASVGVAGLAAVNIDLSEKLADVLPYYIAIIVVLSLIVLTLVFRSILVPLKATLGFLLSIGATFGVITAVFQWGWLKDLVGFDTTGPIVSFLPIMVTGILYGLAMDYEMFLVSSMREEHVQGRTGNDAVTGGFAHAGRVVVAAALIMVTVFAGFVVSDDPTVKQFGLALAVGITIDAFLIRLTLVPALMSYLGGRAWWLPGWMGRVLPHLDVEGSRLNAHVNDATAVR